MLKDYKEELPILAKMILPDPDKWTKFEEIPDRSIIEEELSFFEKIKLLTEFKEIPDRSTTNDKKVIYNQDGYDIGYKWEKKYIKGKALTLADGTPIGYNIFLPEGEVKAIMVEVYGGSPDLTYFYRPDKGFDHFFLRQQGMAIINLNLVDLLKLKTNQTEMPENIHKTLHESIDHFFKTIKHSPEMLDQNLTVLKGKPCYLFGCSFGGRTAIRQAELYPNSFDGYISFEGALSIIKLYETSKMLNEENLVETQNAEQWLCPTKSIDKLQAPILLLQNADDNNVTMKSALDFVEKAKRAGKQDFIRLHITDHGGRKIDVPSIEHGHSLPNNKQSFERMASDAQAVIQDKAFIEGFKSLIVDGNTFRKDIRENHLYLLTIFFMANPELIGEVQEQVNDSDEARRCLMDEIIREKVNIKQVWKQAIHQVITLNIESNNTCYSHETFDDNAPTVLHKRKAEIDHDAKRQRISDREIELSSNAQKRIMNDKQSAAKRVRSG